MRRRGYQTNRLALLILALVFAFEPVAAAQGRKQVIPAASPIEANLLIRGAKTWPRVAAQPRASKYEVHL